MSLLQLLQQIPDPRVQRTRRHELIDLLAIALCATVAGADNWIETVEFAQAHQAWLQRFLRLPCGIASHDTFARVFRRLDPQALEQVLQQWLKGMSAGTSGHVAIDGKSVRSAHGKGKGAHHSLHLVSAWASEQRLLLGQRKVDGKSNEITAIPELLKLLDIGGCTITIDAMGCQKAIAKQIADQGAHYVLSLKGNQRHMFNVCKKHFESAEADRGQQTFSDSDKGHGRIETRKYQVSALPPALQRAAQHWPQLQSLVRVVRTRQLRGQERVSEQTSYYLSSLSAHTSAQQMAQYIRGHWSVENQLHWSLDVGMGDDSGLSQKDHAAHNQALLRRMAQQMLQADTSVKAGLKAKRKRAGWDLTYLERVMGLCI